MIDPLRMYAREGVGRDLVNRDASHTCPLLLPRGVYSTFPTPDANEESLASEGAFDSNPSCM